MTREATPAAALCFGGTYFFPPLPLPDDVLLGLLAELAAADDADDADALKPVAGYIGPGLPTRVASSSTKLASRYMRVRMKSNSEGKSATVFRELVRL